MPAPVVGVLAVQGDVREHVRSLEAAGASPVAVRRPAELARLDGVIVPGGESTAIGKLLESFELLEPLRAAVRDGMPAYGSCAGMILLADTVADGVPGQPTIGGLDLVVRRNAFGRQVDSFESDVVMTGVSGGPVRAVFIRAPEVDKVGAEVEVLATTEVSRRIVAVRQRHLLATSFHPELTGDPRVHALFMAIVEGQA